MCYFELLISSLNLAKIIDDSKTEIGKTLGIDLLSSSKNPYGSKTYTHCF